MTVAAERKYEIHGLRGEQNIIARNALKDNDSRLWREYNPKEFL
jgi:hypothetical protein